MSRDYTGAGSDWQGVLLGCSINTGSTRLAELAGMMGFDTLWIEMEHTSVDLRGAESLCVAAQASGAIPLIRTAGSERDQILQALEIGARIVVVPLVNDRATAERVVEFGRFKPAGKRGFNSRSRGVSYGMEPLDPAAVNGRVTLLPQIETTRAVENLEEIISVPGISGVFIGPGDLSMDLGEPGNFTNPALIERVTWSIRRTREAGLHAGILAAPGPLLDAALDAGADLAIIAFDIAPLISSWRETLERYRPNA
jgi:4-hydroxy-2-oxoheptanedioate aldolase